MLELLVTGGLAIAPAVHTCAPIAGTDVNEPAAEIRYVASSSLTRSSASDRSSGSQGTTLRCP
jgi:hypothetical protein